MTKKELSGIKNGDQVMHKHFGECIMQELLYGFGGGGFMGLVLLPQTSEGQQFLCRLTGMPIGTPVLEGSLMLVNRLVLGEGEHGSGN
jgi:hypothetical protein